jgi:hypothetical protein
MKQILVALLLVISQSAVLAQKCCDRRFIEFLRKNQPV